MTDSGIEQIGSADAVIGLVPASRDAQTVGSAIGRIVEFAPTLKIVLVHPPYSPNGMDPLRLGPAWHLIEHPQLAPDPSSLTQGLGESFRAIFDITQKLGARGCAIVASDLSNVTAEWIALLLEPAVEKSFDLVTPCYATHRFDGMINRAIIYPLVRALYGRQIRNPLGPDFGISSQLLQRIAGAPR
ncbi:MAG TPA: hypothetical protein VNH18_16100, partial [Bryobacteraceae bacterium]|nr:hypothetical protein [Bryobacteraceae bacterium]